MVYICLMAVGMIFRFRSRRWQRIELIERAPAAVEAASLTY